MVENEMKMVQLPALWRMFAKDGMALLYSIAGFIDFMCWVSVNWLNTNLCVFFEIK